ncbi:hypothetical protein IBTHAUMO2_1050004 [Nitrosopumilaceae archaeon]|nr:hypothetical protein IBTHAUMO2_1050004 [Nitrosopumilaceae archaeon]
MPSDVKNVFRLTVVPVIIIIATSMSIYTLETGVVPKVYGYTALGSTGIGMSTYYVRTYVNWLSTSNRLKAIWASQLAKLENSDGTCTSDLLEDVLQNFMSVHHMVLSVRKRAYCAMYMDKIRYLQRITRDAAKGCWFMPKAIPWEVEERAKEMLRGLVKDSGL